MPFDPTARTYPPSRGFSYGFEGGGGVELTVTGQVAAADVIQVLEVWIEMKRNERPTPEADLPRAG